MIPAQLCADIKAATVIADMAIAKLSDAGSCNLDCVFLPTGKNMPISRKSSAYAKAFSDAGVEAFPTESRWWKGYLIIPNTGGQADLRAAYCVALAKVLDERGWKASIYYQLD